ncbi:MAG: transposase [Deltaproteobacteria bacterium]|nr:transposase [Deltaproteobacteria bacterium]
MPRPIRDDYPGAWHHVMHRAARRKAVFRVEGDFLMFLDTLEDTIRRHGIEVHAYSLMPNHYHLLVRSPAGSLSRAMRHLNGVFTQRLNKANDWDGAVFRGRFTSRLVLDERHLVYTIAYIHLNPLKAGLVTRLDADRAWTSHRAYLGKDSKPEWLTCWTVLAGMHPQAFHELVLGLHRGKTDWPDGLSPETGFPTVPIAAPTGQAKAHERSNDDVIGKICEITGVSRKQLRRSVRGPGGNPARRFAVWALSRATRLTQREIGALLGMSATAAAKEFSRVGRALKNFREWESALEEYLSNGQL